MGDKPRQLLDGYTVLDFTHFVAGPTATRLMAGMGAEIIKVEMAPHGDTMIPRANVGYVDRDLFERSQSILRIDPLDDAANAYLQAQCIATDDPRPCGN